MSIPECHFCGDIRRSREGACCPQVRIGSEGRMFEGNERKELEQKMQREGRLPPGQSATIKWPVLHYGSVPRFDAGRWDFKVWGLVENPVKLTWQEFSALPRFDVTRDFHCVTRWSRFDNRW